MHASHCFALCEGKIKSIILLDFSCPFVCIVYFRFTQFNIFLISFQGNVTSFSDSHGNVSRIVGAYEASNGIIMKLDSVLSPPPSSASSPKVRI